MSRVTDLDYGAEYKCIAESLVAGEGFSNPFCRHGASQTDQTAWMPPLLSYLHAFVYLLFGIDSNLSFLTLLFITKAMIAFSAFLLIRLSNEINTKFRHFSLLLLTGYILINPKQLLLSFHDVWLVLFFTIAIIYVLYFYFIKRNISFVPVLLISLLLPLVSPILAFAYMCIISVLFLKDLYYIWKEHKTIKKFFAEHKRSIISYFAILLAFILPIITWGSRNYMVFNKFIPVKSNFWFDFYQANVFDHDGLITSFTFTNFHPVKNESVYREFKALGEVKFMDLYKEKSLNYLKQNPDDYASKVINRFFSTFIFAKHPFDERVDIDDTEIPQADIALLKKEMIISESNSANIQLDYHTFISEIENLQLQNKPEIIKSWVTAKNEYEQFINAPFRVMELLLISGIPFLSWMISIFFINHYNTQVKGLLLISSVLYLSYFLPYIIVSVYTRYQIPFSAIYSLFFYSTGIILIAKIKPSLLKMKGSDQ